MPLNGKIALRPPKNKHEGVEDLAQAKRHAGSAIEPEGSTMPN
jgi:hypothetical protein